MSGPARRRAGAFAVVAGGGTAGHVLPALAVADALVERGHAKESVHFVGAARGMEATMVPEAGYGVTLLEVQGVQRAVSAANARAAARFCTAVPAAVALLRRLRPRVVVSVGGYASVPPVLAAWLCRIPIVVVSYDAVPGAAARMQARLASATAVAFAASRLPRHEVTGAPVRKEILAVERARDRLPSRQRLHLPPDRFTVVVVGGSLGSGTLNGVVAAFAAAHADRADLAVRHVVGSRHDPGAFAPGEHRDGLWYQVVRYEGAMHDAYAAADVVLARAGATTVAELAAVGVPSILVPWPLATEDHQTANAKVLADGGGAVLLPEAELTPERLAIELDQLRVDPARLAAMAERARAAGVRDGAERIAALVERCREDLTVSGPSVEVPLDLRVPGRYHVVGVGGPGMRAIALVLAEMGHEVSGSDVQESPALDRLRAAGITIQVGHAPAHVEGVDAVTASTAIPPGNVELQAAAAAGIAVLRRAGMLASICACARSVAVAGTHGKTTTTSMLAMMLLDAGLSPSFVVGGDVNDVGAGAHWSGGELLVVEADESDGTFLTLPLWGTVLTNVETDHLDHFGSFDAIVRGFEQYLDQVRGPKVLCADDPVAAHLAASRDAITYGTAAGADFRAVDVEVGKGSQSFTVQHDGTPLGRVDLPLRGVHNVRNATGALAMALACGAPFDAAAGALARFGGVGRRFDFRGEHRGITLVDDYAHLPSEIAAVLDAARNGGDGWERVVAVFQPNRYSRMELLSPEYRDAFVLADLTVITDIYPSGETPRPGVTGELVADAVRTAHPDLEVVYVAGRADLIELLASRLRPGDVCVSMGCGDIASLPSEVLVRLGELDGTAR